MAEANGFSANFSMRARARLAVALGSAARSFSTEGLKTTLYEPTCPQSAAHFFKGDGALLAALGHDCQIVKVFHHSPVFDQRHDDSFLFPPTIQQVLKLGSLQYDLQFDPFIIAD
jgi:hypothetical protein